MLRHTHPSFRSVVERGSLVRVAGAHSALGAALAQEAGFQAAWASSFEISAVRCLPDASILSMTEYLKSAADMQKAVEIPVVADCDTGFGNNLNVAHMVHEYEAAGISAVAIEDKQFPKMNSFAAHQHTLVDTDTFAAKIATAKQAQRDTEFFVIARTEALISGHGVDEALDRCHAYVDAGADGVLVHSKAATNDQVVGFLRRWGKRRPVVIVPTTYPDWHVDDMAVAGVAVVIYANQGLRATVSSLRATFRSIRTNGDSVAMESEIASVSDIFELQQLTAWQKLEI